MSNQATDLSPLFLSTAIPYVNAEPHVGHAFELLIGDALGRHQRQRGRDVRLTGGTDDHSAKNARAAEARGVDTAALVRVHGERFAELGRVLDVGLDDYLHTSRDPRHAPAVVALWRRCAANGDLYRRHYRGRYCTGCEAFLQDAELVEGCCAVHAEPVTELSEENWFFRLSRYESVLYGALQSGTLQVHPVERQSEVLSFVESGLSDFSVSRSRERCRGWGIGVPDDPSQIVYVWFDALANYLSLLGFPEPTSALERYWGAQPAGREHLIGKDILRFHALYWPAILLSAGLPLPSAVRVHGFVTAEGKKIGKSSGNSVDPFELVERFGVAAVRFYLLRHLHTTKDSDFRSARLVEAHDSELSGKLGNLLQRVTAIALRHPELRLVRGSAAESDADLALADAAARAAADTRSAIDDFALHHALSAILELVAAANRYADVQEPWILSKRVGLAPSAEARAHLLAQLSHVLWRSFEALRVTAILLSPFLPRAAEDIAKRIGVDARQLSDYGATRFGVGRRFRAAAGPALFPRLAR